MKKINLIIRGEFLKWVNTEKHPMLLWVTFISGILSVLSYINEPLSKVNSSVQSDNLKDKMLEVKDYFSIAMAIIPNKYTQWVIFGICIVAWAVILYYRNVNAEVSKKSVCILGHSTMDPTQYKLSEDNEKELELDITEIQLREDMQKIGKHYENIKYVVNTQDSLIEKFRSQIDRKHTYGYMGLAHTPLIMRAGFKIGDGTKFAMFHKKRDNDYYAELNSSTKYTPIKIEKKEIKDNCKELIVAISTTFPIGDDQLKIFQPQNKSLLKFKCEDMGFDVIVSEKQVMDYISFIFKEIREIEKKLGITKIHMVISSSSIFTFVLGQSVSSTHDAETIVYHYDKDAPGFYPWGINLFKDALECVLISN